MTAYLASKGSVVFRKRVESTRDGIIRVWFVGTKFCQ